MTEVVLSIGSNIGNREWNLSKSIELIIEHIGELICSSSVIESEPWGFECDNSFLNQIVICNTTFTPEEILDKIWYIESSLGKVRADKKTEIEKKRRIENKEDVYKSRSIDIDIIFFGDSIIETKLLTIPHKQMHLRNFVLEPLRELRGNYMHPIYKRSVKDLFNELNKDI